MTDDAEPDRPDTVAAAVLDIAARAGVQVAFGIPGVHNLPMWDADGVVPIVGVRHEQAAVYAADGRYRATGEPGLALLTSGPGAANAMAAFGEAHVSGSPVVVVASDVNATARHPGGPRGILHEMADQAAMFAAFGAPAATVDTDAAAVVQAAAAFRRAVAAPAGPGYLGIPTDVMGASWGRPSPVEPPAAVRLPSDDALSALARLIAASDRVVLWAGGGVVQSGAEDGVRLLAERLGAPVVTTYAGKGLLAGHRLLVDVPPHEPEVADLIASADLLLGLGSSFDGMNTRGWRMPVPPRLAAVGLDDALPRTFDWDVLVTADLPATLAALAPALDEAGVETRRPTWADDPAGMRGRVMSRLAGDVRARDGLAVVSAIEQGWPADGAVVCDMCVAGYWTGGYATQPRPRRLAYPVGWGTLGFALPAAIGPATAGIATLAVCGDGGPMFALGELATYAQESLPVTLLVVDDGGYGMLRFDQQVFGHPERGVDLLGPHWPDLARAFGIGSAEVPDVAALAPALRAAHAANLRGEPRLVVLRGALHPPRTTSPRWFED